MTNTDFNLKLLKGEENDYFDYVRYLNENWDKIDESVSLLYFRENGIYVTEKPYNVSTTSTDNYDAIMGAINAANTLKKVLKFPKGEYKVSKELVINQANIDMLFEKGTIITGNVKLTNLKNSVFSNLTVNGNLTIDSVESCKFLNITVTGKTNFGTSIRGKDSTLNHFTNCVLKNELNMFCEETVQPLDPKVKMKVTNNTFINCSIVGTNFGIYSNVSTNVINSSIAHNIFMSSTVRSTASNSTAVYLGKDSYSFQFIEQVIEGTNSIDISTSLGKHTFSGGSLIGNVIGSDKFLSYKPSISDNASFEKIGNNINHTRKMKVFKGEVPKWTRDGVNVSNDTLTTGFTGNECLKITSTNIASFTKLQRTFSVSDHLNQPINVIARIKATSVANTAPAAIMLIDGKNDKELTLETDNQWKIVTLKIENNENRDVNLILTPNNSFDINVSSLYIDWIIVALGDFVQFSSVPSEEHHYSNLEHFGNFAINGNASVDELTIKKDSTFLGTIVGDFDIRNGDLSVLKNTLTTNSSDSSFDIGALNPNSVNDLSTFKYRFKVVGNHEGQILKIYAINRSRLNGADIESPQEIFEISEKSASYKGKKIVVQEVGSTRPQNPDLGMQFFDTTINKPIWYSGTEWVDAMGTQV